MPKITQILQGFSMGTSQGNLAFCGVSLIEGSKRILVDVAHPGRRSLLVQKLAERGLTPDDIDCVFLTHAHWDHMLNIDLFPKAKVLMNDVERQYIKKIDGHDWATMAYASSVIESMQTQSLSDGEEVDDGVSMLATPGHSKGSATLLVRGDDGSDVGDLRRRVPQHAVDRIRHAASRLRRPGPGAPQHLDPDGARDHVLPRSRPRVQAARRRQVLVPGEDHDQRVRLP